MGFVRKIGRKIDDYILQPIKENPIGAIVSVGGMALGIPPVYAGALGGAAGAAATGGDILKGALVGGAAGFAGGTAAGAAVRAGAGNILAGAAGGAAAGGVGAALTGGNIIKGAFTGGILGGLSGAARQMYQDVNGNTVRINDDGSTITRNGRGDIVSVTPATDGTPAPIYEYNPVSGRVELISPNGELRILDAQQTAELMRNVDPNLINQFAESGEPLRLGSSTDTVIPDDVSAVDSGADGAGGGEPFRVEVKGLPGTVENPSYAVEEFRTPNTNLASFADIDAGRATWNAAANAWEVGATPGTGVYDPATGNTLYRFDDGSSFTQDLNGNIIATTPATDFVGGGTGGTGGAGGTGSAGSIGAADEVYQGAGGTTGGTGGAGSIGAADEVYQGAGGTTPVTGPAPTTGGPGDTAVVNPTPVTPTTPFTPTTPGWTTPVTPVFPVLPTTPSTPTTPTTPSTPSTPSTPGVVPQVTPMQGLNPGFINPTAFYNTTSPAQSKFSWGARDFQPGPAFNAQLYNQAPASEAPWGMQNIAQPLTAQEIETIMRGGALARPQLPVATRVERPLVRVTAPVAAIPANTVNPTLNQFANTPGLGSTGIGVNLPGLVTVPRPPTGPVTQAIAPTTSSPFVVGPGGAVQATTTQVPLNSMGLPVTSQYTAMTEADRLAMTQQDAAERAAARAAARDYMDQTGQTMLVTGLQYPTYLQ